MPEVSAKEENMSKGRILVVSDQPNIRRALRITLGAEGYEVTDAETGNAALCPDLVRKHDLVLLDSDMTDSTGVETCREIRSGSDIGVVVMSARAPEEDKAQALEAGARDYISKPFGMAEIKACVRANMSGQRQTPPAFQAELKAS